MNKQPRTSPDLWDSEDDKDSFSHNDFEVAFMQPWAPSLNTYRTNNSSPISSLPFVPNFQAISPHSEQTKYGPSIYEQQLPRHKYGEDDNKLSLQKKTFPERLSKSYRNRDETIGYTEELLQHNPSYYRPIESPQNRYSRWRNHGRSSQEQSNLRGSDKSLKISSNSSNIESLDLLAIAGDDGIWKRDRHERTKRLDIDGSPKVDNKFPPNLNTFTNNINFNAYNSPSSSRISLLKSHEASYPSKVSTTRYSSSQRLPSRSLLLQEDTHHYYHYRENPEVQHGTDFEHYGFNNWGYHSNTCDPVNFFNSRTDNQIFHPHATVLTEQTFLSDNLNNPTLFKEQTKNVNNITKKKVPNKLLKGNGFMSQEDGASNSKKSKEVPKKNTSLIHLSNVPEVFTLQNSSDVKSVYSSDQSRTTKENYDDSREDFEEKQRRRKRNHVIFLMMVLLFVAVAVISAVLAATLGNRPENGEDNEKSKFSIVRANLTLKILNKLFEPEMHIFGSNAFQNLAIPYSLELDELFLRSKLASVYTNNQIISFRNGSIYATSSMTFVDAGLITSPKDVENVIVSADVASDWKTPDALKLGEFVVCRTCAEAKLEYVTITDKPEIMLHNLDSLAFQENNTDENTINITDSTVMTVLTESPNTLATTETTAPERFEPPTTSSHTTSHEHSSPGTSPLATSKASSTTPPSTSFLSTSTTTAAGITSASSVESPTTQTMAAFTTASTATSQAPTTSTTTPALTTKSSSISTEITTIDVSQAPTAITVSNVTAVSTDSFVIVMCTISNPSDWSAVNLEHTLSHFEDSNLQTTNTIVRLNSKDLYVVTTFGKMYEDRVRVDYNVSHSRIDIRLDISKIGCHDDGYIDCSLTGRTVSRTSGRGRLEVIVPPSPPTMTMPVEVVANVAMTIPITCEAQVGYPAWGLKMSAQMAGASSFQDLPAEEEKTLNGCTTTIVLRLRPYTPVFASNGTVIRCELVQQGLKIIKTDVMYVTEQLLVVGGSVCRGKPDNLKLRHPYNCSSYIICQGQQPNVFSCSSGQCFDTISGQCGLTSVIVESTNGFLNEGLAGVTCSVIHVNDWSEIMIRKVMSPTEFVDVLSVDPYGNITWHDLSLSIRALTNFRSAVLETVLELWVYVLKCGDEAIYTCSVRGPTQVKDGKAELKVYAKPETPTLVVPRSVVEGSLDTVSISCEANLGRPPATLTLMKKLPNQSSFLPANFTDMTPEGETGCGFNQKRAYVTSATAESNGTIFRCDLISSSDVHGQINLLSNEIALHILKATTCQELEPTLLPHTLDCRYFIQCARFETTVLSCGPGLCFNAQTQQCDILTSTSSPLVMGCPQDSVFLPHPSLCNKYIRCEMGREIIQHCQQGQLYTKDGACSSNIRDSFCFIKVSE